MPKETKACFIEYDKRVNKIYELLNYGFTRHQILEYVGKKTDWNIKRSQIDYYIAEAKEIRKEYAKQTQEEFLEESKARLDDIYMKAMSEKNLAECRQVILTKNKVLGYETSNIKHSGSIEIDESQVKEKISELLALRQKDADNTK
jgi:hypothetical protein